MVHRAPKAKFLDNTNNKSELINLQSSAFGKHNIIVDQCDNDADLTVGNLLPSLTLFPLYPVEPFAINYKSGAGLASQVKRIG